MSNLPAEYSRRQVIETGYAGVEELRARTTRRNHAFRLLLFYYSMIFYNTWLLIDIMMEVLQDAVSADHNHGRAEGRVAFHGNQILLNGLTL